MPVFMVFYSIPLGFDSVSADVSVKTSADVSVKTLTDASLGSNSLPYPSRWMQVSNTDEMTRSPTSHSLSFFVSESLKATPKRMLYNVMTTFSSKVFKPIHHYCQPAPSLKAYVLHTPKIIFVPPWNQPHSLSSIPLNFKGVTALHRLIHPFFGRKLPR